MAYAVLGHYFIRPQEKLLFIFDRKPKFVQLSNLMFETMLEVHPWVKRLVSDQIIFASREAHVPLQAADMLAYETYKRAIDPQRTERKLFSALRPAFDSIKVFRDEELASFNFENYLGKVRANAK